MAAATSSADPQESRPATASSEDAADTASEIADRGALLLPDPEPMESQFGSETPSVSPESPVAIEPEPAPTPETAFVVGLAPAGSGDVAALLARAERAEKRTAQLEAEVRRLRLELLAARRAPVGRGAADSVEAGDPAMPNTRSDDSPHEANSRDEDRRARASAEERAARAEAEVLQLYCELEAFRTAMFGDSATTTTSAPVDLPSTRSGLIARCCAVTAGMLRNPARQAQEKLADAAGRTPIQAVKADFS